MKTFPIFDCQSTENPEVHIVNSTNIPINPLFESSFYEKNSNILRKWRVKFNFLLGTISSSRTVSTAKI